MNVLQTFRIVETRSMNTIFSASRRLLTSAQSLIEEGVDSEHCFITNNISLNILEIPNVQIKWWNRIYESKKLVDVNKGQTSSKMKRVISERDGNHLLKGI